MPDPPEPLEWKIPLLERLKPVFLTLILAGPFLWMITLAILQFAILPHWTNPRRGKLAAALVAPVALAFACRSFLKRYHSVVYRHGCLELGRGLATDVIPTTDVVALIGVVGVNLDGGPMIAWKRLTILTWDRHYSLEFHRYANAWLYRSLRPLCPQAWGLPWRGQLEPPSNASRAHGRGVNTIIIGTLQKYYRKQIGRTLSAALILAATSIAALIWIVRNANTNDAALKVLMYLIVAIVLAVLLLAETRRASHVLREISKSV
jgi:hypothetical protein